MVKNPDSQTASSDQSLPLFFKTPFAIDVTRHKNSGVKSGADYRFAKQTNSIPLNVIEFLEAVKYYPIVFTPGDSAFPVALLGLEQDNNYVDAQGQWREGTYTPAYARQYPFIFVEHHEDKKLYLCVDETSERFCPTAENPEDRLFNEENASSELTEHALKFCEAFYQHHQITRNFCADLKKHHLLMPQQSDVTLASGRSITLRGFEILNEQAFNKLPEKVFLEFRKKGWLPFIYLALASASNWKALADSAGE